MLKLGMMTDERTCILIIYALLAFMSSGYEAVHQPWE